MAKIYLLLMILLAGRVWAEAELFDVQDGAARFSGKSREVDFGAIEPASGVAREAAADLQRDVSSQIVVDTGSPDHAAHGAEGGDVKAEAAAEGSGEAKAEGGHGGGEAKPEGAHAGGKNDPLPAFPTVTIGGKQVVTHAMQVADDVSASTPVGLRERGMDEVLNHRANIVPYAHNPIKGSVDAPIQVVLFEDLSCATCLPTLGKIDAALADYASKTQVIHVHTPSKNFQDTNLPAFYGKVAQRQGKFWEYRAALIAANAVDDKVVFDLLLKTGSRERDVRALMVSDARRFYRELDADVTLARNFAVGKPPVVFVNGIRMGSGGLPLDKLGDVLTYVSQRISRGLPEPGP